MIYKPHLKALKEFNERLDGRDIEWTVKGSVNLTLHGIDLSSDDLDIATTVEGAKRIREIFRDEIVSDLVRKEPSVEEWPDYYDMEIEIDGIIVHLLGGVKEDPYFRDIYENRREIIEEGGMEIPCCTLEVEEDAYRNFDRLEKVNFIRNHLNG